MAARAPFVLLDDARVDGAADAQLFEGPREVFVARRPDEVAGALAAADAIVGQIEAVMPVKAGT